MLIFTFLNLIENEIDGLSIKLIKVDSDAGRQLLPDLSSQLKFHQMMINLEKKFEEESRHSQNVSSNIA